MKVKTVEQFVILQEIQKHFNMNAISVNLIERNVVQIIDRAGVKLNFRHEEGYVRCDWPEDQEVCDL